jgi:hypothetical protein
MGRNNYDVGGGDCGTHKQVHADTNIRYLRRGRKRSDHLRVDAIVESAKEVSSVVPPLQRPVDGGTGQDRTGRKDQTANLGGRRACWHLFLPIRDTFLTKHRT